MAEVDQDKVEKVVQKLDISAGKIRAALTFVPVDVDLEDITAFGDIRAAYERAPEDSEAQRLAMAKWNHLSKKQVEQATTFYDITAAYYNAPEDSEVQRLALAKWNDFSKKRVEQAVTFDDARIAFISAFWNGEAEYLAIKKWLSLCTTPADAQAVFGVVAKNNKARRLTLAKWNDLSQKQDEQATTIAEVKVAFDNAPSDSEAERLAIKKMYELID